MDLKEGLAWTEDFEEVHSEIVDQGRWTTTIHEVYRHTPTGKHYGLYIDRGSTEYQEVKNPWDELDDDEEYELTEYEGFETVVIKWQEKK